MLNIIHTCIHAHDDLSTCHRGVVLRRTLIAIVILLFLFCWMIYAYQEDNVSDLYDKYGTVRMEKGVVIDADWSGAAIIQTSSRQVYHAQCPYATTGDTVLCWIVDNHTPNTMTDDKIVRTEKV